MYWSSLAASRVALGDPKSARGPTKDANALVARNDSDDDSDGIPSVRRLLSPEYRQKLVDEGSLVQVDAVEKNVGEALDNPFGYKSIAGSSPDEPIVVESDISSSDNPTASATLQDDAQSREMASAIALVETPVTTDSHCCSCQVLDDIMTICRGGNAVGFQQSLLFNYFSDLEAYGSTHVDRAHSTVGLLNMLLDFVKRTYTSSAERHSTLSAASSSSPSLLLPASDELLTLSQPATKIVDLESKLAKAHRSRDTAVSNLQKFWDEGWEPIVFEFDNATPNLSYYLHPLDYSDAAFSEMSADDASNGTSFESGSEMSCEVDGIVEQTEAAEESLGLETNRQLCRHPATPPASPDTSTPVVQSGNQENEMTLSSGLAKELENVLKDAE